MDDISEASAAETQSTQPSLEGSGSEIEEGTGAMDNDNDIVQEQDNIQVVVVDDGAGAIESVNLEGLELYPLKNLTIEQLEAFRAQKIRIRDLAETERLNLGRIQRQIKTERESFGRTEAVRNQEKYYWKRWIDNNMAITKHDKDIANINAEMDERINLMYNDDNGGTRRGDQTPTETRALVDRTATENVLDIGLHTNGGHGRGVSDADMQEFNEFTRWKQLKEQQRMMGLEMGSSSLPQNRQPRAVNMGQGVDVHGQNFVPKFDANKPPPPMMPGMHTSSSIPRHNAIPTNNFQQSTLGFNQAQMGGGNLTNFTNMSGMVTPGGYGHSSGIGGGDHFGRPIFASESTAPRLIGVPYGQQNGSYVIDPKGGSNYIKEYYISEPKLDRKAREAEAVRVARLFMGRDADDAVVESAGKYFSNYLENIGSNQNTSKGPNYDIKKVETNFDKFTTRKLKEGIRFDDLERQLACGIEPKLTDLLPKSFHQVPSSASALCLHTLCTSIMEDMQYSVMLRKYFANQRDDINFVEAQNASKEQLFKELKVRRHTETRPMTAAQTQFMIECPQLGSFSTLQTVDQTLVKQAQLKEWKQYSTDPKQNGLMALSTAHSVIDKRYSAQGGLQVLLHLFVGQPLRVINLVWHAKQMGRNFPHVWKSLVNFLSSACATARYKGGEKDIEKLIMEPPIDGMSNKIWELREARKNYMESQGMFADDREENINQQHRVDVFQHVWLFFWTYYPTVEDNYMADLKHEKEIKDDDPHYEYDANEVLLKAVTRILTERVQWSDPELNPNKHKFFRKTGRSSSSKNPYVDNKFAEIGHEPQNRLPALGWRGDSSRNPRSSEERGSRGILSRSTGGAGRQARALSPAMRAIPESLREQIRREDFGRACFLCNTPGHPYTKCTTYPNATVSDPKCKNCGGYHGNLACKGGGPRVDAKLVNIMDDAAIDEQISQMGAMRDSDVREEQLKALCGNTEEEDTGVVPLITLDRLQAAESSL